MSYATEAYLAVMDLRQLPTEEDLCGHLQEVFEELYEAREEIGRLKDRLFERDEEIETLKDDLAELREP